MRPLTSRQNPLIKRLRDLHQNRGRRAAGEFLLEGRNSVEAAIAANWPLRVVLGSEAFASQLENLEASGVESYLVPEEILEAVAESKSSPGIIAVGALPAAQPEWELEELLLIIDGVADPGNVGTLLRAADAAGAERVILTAGCADPWAPKVVRSAAGSLLKLTPLGLDDHSPAGVMAELRARNIPLIAAEAHAGQNCFDYHWPRRCALVLGHETRGVSPEFQALATAVNIPVFGSAESLNVAMAGTLLLYAWRNGMR